ncbi:MAG: FtsH protease activity modulator HflK, partial [Arenimonas sp.]
ASVVAKAQGDAKRFSLLVEQYRKAPEVTRKRLYLETMQEVLAKNQKVLSGRDNNVFYLPLNGTGMPSPENAATRMAPVQAVIGNDIEDNKVERSPRREGREGSR